MVKRKANIGRYTRKNKRRVSQQVGLDDDNNNIDLDDNENRNVDLDLDQDVGLSTRQDPDPDLDPAPRRVLVDLDPNVNQQDVRLEVQRPDPDLDPAPRRVLVDLDPNVNQQDVRLEVRHKLSAMDKSCNFCQARLFKEEAKGLCCANGQVVLPPLQPTPPQLRDLFITNSQIAKEFRANIRSYNNSLAFASLGANEDILPPGVYAFRINGETHHRIGHLIPDDGAKPRFAQIYIHDPLNEMQNRVHWNNHLNVNVLQLLQNIIHDVNPFFQYYKNAASVIANDESSAAQVQMILRADSAKDGRRYNLPTAAEIAVIIPDEGSNIGYRDIVLHRKSSDVPNLPPVVNIHETHQHYDPLHYVLFFPHGEEGWKIGISFNGNRKGQVSPMNYYAYRLMHRTDFDIVLYGGRLLQQYIVDQFSKMESQRLRFIRKNQIKLRAELYKGLADAVAHGDSDGTTVGQKVILPASYTSSPRNMLQLYHDAMAIVRKYGKPDLFITFTCNPTWPEIKQNLFPNQNASDRPDLIARVFRLKLSAFMDDLIKKNYLET